MQREEELLMQRPVLADSGLPFFLSREEVFSHPQRSRGMSAKSLKRNQPYRKITLSLHPGPLIGGELEDDSWRYLARGVQDALAKALRGSA